MPAVGSGRPAARSAFANAVGRSAARGHHLAGRAHLGPEHRVAAGEARERQHRRLHAHLRRRPLRRQREVAQLRAGGEPARGLDEVDAGRLRRERHRPRRARVRLEHVDRRPSATASCTLIRPTSRAPARAGGRSSSTSRAVVAGQGRRRQHAGRVAGVDARLLDVLHDRGDVRLLAVAERVDVDLDRVLDEAVDEHRAREVGPERLDHLGAAVADAHRAAAEHVRRPHEHRVADPVRDLAPPRARSRRSPTPGSGSRAASSSAPKRSRSSARSIASNGVPRIRKPAASIARASFSGVWPPNWITTPSGCSRSQTASTSSAPSGSK